jgi:hypothetical protein
MDGLTRPFDPTKPARQPLLPFSLLIFVPFVLLLAGGWGLGKLGAVSPVAVRVIGVTGVHGGLLAGALATAWRGASGWAAPAAVCAGLLFLAAALSHVSAWGGLSYVLVPVALGVLASKRKELEGLGLSLRWNLRALALGLAVGLFLGIHLLITTSLTLGHQVRVFPLAPVLGALAYDVGANVCSAECFFRGALFGHWQRRWGFWGAASAATGLSVVRYLIDPSLPKTGEVVTGAFFYLSLLGFSGCALLWWSGSLLPPALATLAFFAAYRTLAGQ